MADSGHHQIVLYDSAGRELRRFGSGAAGFEDGIGAATFDGPQGLAATAEALFVADTGNHALRRIGLADGAVTTLAGTGRRGGALGGPAPAGSAALASPWDCEVLDGGLVFANAGTHQLGRLDFGTGLVARLAGSGVEALIDGPAAEAALAQPSGLAPAADGALYFADSETSAIRRLAPGPAPRVETLAGAGLFEFGHVNGPLAAARLQHPLGLAALGDGRLAVADSYNNAVRLLDPAAGTLEDLDAGFACLDPLCLPYGEPAGIAAAGPGRLLLSDTNNHRIVEIDMAARTTRQWAG
ncbi:MAG TPA: hypothetical protein VEH84_09650 [Alphaproteobacteria bacterium]|nr:hypothetical protein [Alphaproteobacteria bacterium]